MSIDSATARFVVDHEGEWIKAQDLPERCEGMFAWKWHPMMQRPEFDIVPRGYSREHWHCEGWHYMLVTMPVPPDLPNSPKP